MPATGATVPYDPRKDLVGVGILAYSPSVLVVNDTVPIKDVPALIAYAKQHPGELMAATTGNGTGQHFAAVFFDEQHLIECQLGAGLSRCPVDPDELTGYHLHLTTTRLNDCVHNQHLIKGDSVQPK